MKFTLYGHEISVKKPGSLSHRKHIRNLCRWSVKEAADLSGSSVGRDVWDYKLSMPKSQKPPKPPK